MKEQYETSDEELRASSEELRAINKELRSAGKELETGKEELQWANEDLVTVNRDLKSDVADLGRANSDLQNLMAATDIGTIFLDRQLSVKRFTPRAQDVFNLIPADVGRPYPILLASCSMTSWPRMPRKCCASSASLSGRCRMMPVPGSWRGSGPIVRWKARSMAW